ncbi:MAG: FAD binding domain-containing protein [Anaerolineales bacterium]|nr:FAD binding domain-containing protein [Anaerolineales bacterium]
MAIWQNYHLAQTVSDALQALADAPGEARLVAGGTDFLLDLQQGRHPPVHTLVDITQISEMNTLEMRQGQLYIGAARPLNQIVDSPLVYLHARALNESAGLIGGPQVRNTATLGGNVAHALPAGDGTISLLALDAQAEIASASGRRRVPVSELFLGPGRSALDPRRELLVGFYLPAVQPGQASAFRRVMRPQGVAIAILNMAVWLERWQDRIQRVRISIGPAGPVPLRLKETEAVLNNQKPDEHVLTQAVEALLSEAHFRTSPHRATAQYRQRIAATLLHETLTLAWQRTYDHPQAQFTGE